MSPEPVVVRPEDRDWEGWPAEQAAQRGETRWKTLISAGVTPSEALTLGVATLAPGGSLHPHRHAQPEVYFVLDGEGIVTIGGAASPIGPGVSVFIPGDAVHSVRSTGRSDLRVVYAFATDCFEDVEYVFEA